MKKTLTRVFVIIGTILFVVASGVFGFFADDWFKENHECTYATEYSYNKTHHFKACTSDACTKVIEEEIHADIDKDHKCDACLMIMTECVDINQDHECDICDNYLSVCADINNDKECDICSADLKVYRVVNNIYDLKSALITEGIDVILLNTDLDLKDVNENDAILIESGKHVLDLNGHTIKGVDNPSKSVWHAILVKGNETELTIKDSSEGKTGTIIGRCYGIQVSRGAKLTIESGNFTCTQNGSYNQSVVVYGGTLVVNGGTFTSRVYESIYGQAYTWDEQLCENTITINGGVFNYIGETSDCGVMYFKGDNQTVIVNGGTFNKGEIEFDIFIDGDTTYIDNADVNDNLDN